MPCRYPECELATQGGDLLRRALREDGCWLRMAARPARATRRAASAASGLPAGRGSAGRYVRALTGLDMLICLLTELRWEFLQFRGHVASCWLESPVMVEQEEPGRDLAGLV